MGEAVLVLLVISVLALLFGGALLGIIAFGFVVGMRRRVADLALRVERLAERPPAAPEPPLVIPVAEPAPPPPAPEPTPPTVEAETPETGQDGAPPPVEVEPPAPYAEPAPVEWAELEGTAASRRHMAAWGRTLDRLEKSGSAEKPERSDWAHLEEVLGTRWLTWAGVLALFFAVAFGVKHAFERGWITEPMRVGLGVAAGLALLVFGDLAVRKAMRAFGQALIGGGLAMLYASLYAASPAVYDVIRESAVAFAAMVVVTVAGMTLSVRHDALPISFIAVLGGVLTPVLLSTGVDERDALFTYLLLLDLGVLGVALFRRWRALDVLAFAGTVVLYAGWSSHFYKPAAMVPALLWLGAFYIVFLVLPFVHHLRHREEIAPERIGMAVGNATLAFACAYSILGMEHRHVLGYTAMAMSAGYLVLARLVRRRIPEDSQGLLAMTALSVALLSIAVPLHLKLEALAIAWAVEAPLLVYLGYRYRYRAVRLWAILPLVAAGIRAASLHWPTRTELFTPVWNAHFGTTMAVAVAAWVLAVIHQANAGDATPADHLLKRLAAIGAGLFALQHVQAETGLYFRRTERPYLARCAVMTAWTAGALAYLGAGLRLRSRWALRTSLLPLAVACVLGIAAYERGAPQGYTIILSLRFGAALLVVGAMFCYSVLVRRFQERIGADGADMSQVLLWAGIAALLVLLSAEAYAWCIRLPLPEERARWMALMSLSLVWGVYASVLLTVGFLRRKLPLRMAALGLFAATALKLVVVDMTGVQQLYRIISFLVLGALMIAAAYAYHRIERRFGEQGEAAA